MRLLELGWRIGRGGLLFASRYNVEIVCVTNSLAQAVICRRKFSTFGGARARDRH